MVYYKPAHREIQHSLMFFVARDNELVGDQNLKAMIKMWAANAYVISDNFEYYCVISKNKIT